MATKKYSADRAESYAEINKRLGIDLEQQSSNIKQSETIASASQTANLETRDATTPATDSTITERNTTGTRSSQSKSI